MVRKIRVLNLSEAKRIALMQGLSPCITKETDKYTFAKQAGADQKKLSWAELEQVLSEEKMAIYEIGGYMKILKKEGVEVKEKSE